MDLGKAMFCPEIMNKTAKKKNNNRQKMCCGAEEHVLVEIPGFIFHKQPADLWQEAAHMQDL